jgi:methylenetetrahydrofolate dehydrogenase (NADP+)/methenyltetrahydrofolate cyclohydrolase
LTARILNGHAIAAEVRAEIQERIDRLTATGVTAGLAVILVGDDAGSASYVKAKTTASAQLGIFAETIRPAATVSQDELLALVKTLNDDARFHGILVQLPLPAHLDPEPILRAVDPRKDVDGLHPYNLGLLMRGEPGPVPCTPEGIRQILLRSGCDPAGRHVVIAGRSSLVGKPLANLLLLKQPGSNATVTVCHTGTPDLGAITRTAEILVVAAGRPGTVTADMVCPGAIVIDVGTNRIPDATRKSGSRLVGDVDFDGVSQVASAITPVPGGVGPMTVTMLLANTVAAAERSSRHPDL